MEKITVIQSIQRNVQIQLAGPPAATPVSCCCLKVVARVPARQAPLLLRETGSRTAVPAARAH